MNADSQHRGTTMKIAGVAMALLLAICLAVLLSACGGGNGDDELEGALRSVTNNDLAIMVLPREDLGEEFAHLEIDHDSGFVDNEEAADGTVDPHDTAGDLERAGRVTGYELEYDAPDFLSALQVGAGVLETATQVDLFRGPSAASDFLAEEVSDHQRFEGKEIAPDLILEEVETFAVDGLADAAMGLRARAGIGDAKLHLTFVLFRLDRVVAGAWVFRADDSNVDSQVQTIARALERRIEGVLLGDIVGTPVPLPQAEEHAR